MSWQTVAICDEHWREEEGDRQPIRMKGPLLELEHCYRCDTPLFDGVIYTRREVAPPPEGAG